MFDGYSQHRHSGESSPNVVMEEPAVLAEVRALAGQRILDLGCGDASFGRNALEAGCSSYLGVDGSSLMVTKARQVLAGTRGNVVQADLEDWSGPAAAFDVALSRLAFHYLEHLAPTLASCHNSLVPGGRSSRWCIR